MERKSCFYSFYKKNKEGHQPEIRLSGIGFNGFISLDVVVAAFSAAMYPVANRIYVRTCFCLLNPLFK